MYTRRSRKNSKRQKTLGWKGNCQGQLPLSTTYSFSPLSPRRNRATYRLQQSTTTTTGYIIAKLLDVIALSRRRNPPPPTSGAKIRRKVIHDMCTFLSLFLSLLFTLSVSLSLDGVDRVRETGLERGQHTGSGKKRENGYVQEEENTRLFLKNKSINEHFFPSDSRLVLEKINLILKIRNFHSVIITRFDQNLFMHANVSTRL